VIAFIARPGRRMSKRTTLAGARRSVSTLGHLLLGLGSRTGLLASCGDGQGLAASVADGVRVGLLHKS
jgi:hypothetical protein